MIDIRKKKVKAIYFNAFHCPECGLELHMDNIVLMTYPAQYSYSCDCSFCTTSSQKPELEYEFEDEDLPPAFPERITQIFNPHLEENELNSLKSLVNYIHTIDPAIVDITTYQEPLSNFLYYEEPIAEKEVYNV